jgi:hypothetical protein
MQNNGCYRVRMLVKINVNHWMRGILGYKKFKGNDKKMNPSNF